MPGARADRLIAGNWEKAPAAPPVGSGEVSLQHDQARPEGVDDFRQSTVEAQNRACKGPIFRGFSGLAGTPAAFVAGFVFSGAFAP